MRPYALTIAVLWIVVLAYWIIAASKARRNMSVGQGGLGWLALRAA